MNTHTVNSDQYFTKNSQQNCAKFPLFSFPYPCEDFSGPVLQAPMKSGLIFEKPHRNKKRTLADLYTSYDSEIESMIII